MNEILRRIKEKVREKRELGQLKEDFNGEPPKVYCMKCRVKVSVNNPIVKVIEVKKGSKRTFLTGKCNQCTHSISGLIKNKDVGGL